MAGKQDFGDGQMRRHHSDPMREWSDLRDDCRSCGIEVHPRDSINDLRGKLNSMQTYGPSVSIRSKWS
jgi:hypothetical protein